MLQVNGGLMMWEVYRGWGGQSYSGTRSSVAQE